MVARSLAQSLQKLQEKAASAGDPDMIQAIDDVSLSLDVLLASARCASSKSTLRIYPPLF